MKHESRAASWRRLWKAVSLDCDADRVVRELEGTLSSDGFMAVTFVNPAAYRRVLDSSEYLELLERHDLVLCDGMGMVWAARAMWGIRVERISFDTTSLAPHIFSLAAALNLPLAVVGGRTGIAEQAAERLRHTFAGLRIVDVHDGYFETIDAACRWAGSSKGRIILCGMGIPQQERFAMALRQAGWKGAVFTCGGYLDQLAVGINYYPAWVDRLNIRFLYRLYREPRRLAKRYLYDYTWFVAATAKASIATRLLRRRP